MELYDCQCFKLEVPFNTFRLLGVISLQKKSPGGISEAMR